MKIIRCFTLLAVVVSVMEGMEAKNLDTDRVTCNNKAEDDPEYNNNTCFNWMVDGYCTHPDADTRKRTHELCMKSCAPVIGVQCGDSNEHKPDQFGSKEEFIESLRDENSLMGNCGCTWFPCCTKEIFDSRVGPMEWGKWQKGQGKMWATYGPWQHNWQEKTTFDNGMQEYDSGDYQNVKPGYDYPDYEAAYGVPEYGSGDYSDYDYADYEGSN